MNNHTLSRPADIHSLAQTYFSYMAQTFPVMCLSDEFYFFPRAEEAVAHLGSMESLDKDTIGEATHKVGIWLGESDRSGDETDDSSALLLSQSMAGFLREFDKRMVWQEDPTLYLKISLLGLDQLLCLEQHGSLLERDWVKGRLEAIPGVIKSGKRNLRHTSATCAQAALAMARQCSMFLSTSCAHWLDSRFGRDRDMSKALDRAVGAVGGFINFLPSVPETRPFAAGEEILALTLRESFGFSGTVPEVLESALDEEAGAQQALEKIARQIDPEKSWQTIYNGIVIKGLCADAVLDHYWNEVKGLETFYRKGEIVPFPPAGSVVVEETPLFLQPIRATASYCSPFPGMQTGRGRFFVNTERDGQHVSSESDLSALHREVRFLSAHETYPGHHVLDWNRMHLSDPIRRQIESALFYEGWACYGEQLTDESGYQPDLRQSLIRIKRDLWRAVRARLDIELHTGTLSLEQGTDMLCELGYPKQSALKQVRRYALTPGYQLCYTLGKREILSLKKQFVPPLSLRNFHSIVLGEGEVPFHCLERSLKKAASEIVNHH